MLRRSLGHGLFLGVLLGICSGRALGAGGGCGYDPAGWSLEDPANTVWVSVAGTDGGDCGASGSPCRTIETGLARSQAGDVVAVGAGTYEESALEVPSGVWLVSGDGPLQAKIYSGERSAVRFIRVTGAGIDGFEIYGDWDTGPRGDGLVRVLDANDIVIRNCMIHDAPHDQDCVKVSGRVDGLLLERLVIWNPARRATGHFQENIDLFGSDGTLDGVASVRNVTVRGSWLFHTPETGGGALLYAKASAENILYEDNVFGPGQTPGGEGDSIIAGGHTADSRDNSSLPGWNFIVRNNVFTGLQGDCALGVPNVENVWVHNNVFYANSGPDLRAVIQFRGHLSPVKNANVFNNVFSNNHPERKGGILYRVREGGVPDPLAVASNLYFDTIATADIEFTGDAGSVYNADPLFASPAVPATSPLPADLDAIDRVRGTFKLAKKSPAVDAGFDVVASAGYPGWAAVTGRTCDGFRTSRPQGPEWDMGVHERVQLSAPQNVRLEE